MIRAMMVNVVSRVLRYSHFLGLINCISFCETGPIKRKDYFEKHIFTEQINHKENLKNFIVTNEIHSAFQ